MNPLNFLKLRTNNLSQKRKKMCREKNIHRQTNNLEGVAIGMKDLKKQLKIKAMDNRMEIRPVT